MKRNSLRGEQCPLKGKQLPMFPGASYEGRKLLLPVPEQHERPKQEVLSYEQARMEFQAGGWFMSALAWAWGDVEWEIVEIFDGDNGLSGSSHKITDDHRS